MIRLINAVLAAILGSGGSAAPAQHSRIPGLTYDASALAQPAGGVAGAEDQNVIKGTVKSTNVFPKAGLKDSAIKSEVKADTQSRKVMGKHEAKPQASPKKAAKH
jgi:hypothetical protein